jgi:hypothetical protein
MEHPIVAECVMDDPDALAFLRDIAAVLHTWDDLSDRDKPVSEDDVFAAFVRALITIPTNSFYAEHQGTLLPVLLNAIVNWRAANTLERGGAQSSDDLMIAFVIRSAYVDLLTTSAVIVGGVEWAAAKAVEIRRWAHGEGYDGYLKNLKIEREAREGA